MAIAANEADSKCSVTGFSQFSWLDSILGWRSSVPILPAEPRSLQPATTIIWGDNDTLGEQAAVRDEVDPIPNVSFEPVCAGHVWFLRYPERWTELIRG